LLKKKKKKKKKRRKEENKNRQKEKASHHITKHWFCWQAVTPFHIGLPTFYFCFRNGELSCSVAF